jgi:hypothetical protein
MPRHKLTKEDADIRYSNWISTLIDLIRPANLYVIGGRGTAKSTDILAKRAIDIVYDMPRASFAFVSDTYVNLMTNIIPSIILGWESRLNFHEYTQEVPGHFVVDQEPPANWPKPYIKTFSYKHTISTFNGCKFFLTSLDRPSANAGISVVHQFGDEAKYLQEEKLNKLFPTLRGDYRLYGHSHYFMGQTFCSDMPDPNVGESDWMMRMEKKMDREQILRIIQTAMIVNEINWDIYYGGKAEDEKRVDHAIKNRDAWQERLHRVRQDSTFFYIVSSFANADILTLKYFKNLLETLDFEEFKTAVLSIRKTLEKGARFYGNLSDRHFYRDGYNYDYYDQFGLSDNLVQNSAGLRYIQEDKLLEAGFDAGNMMSLVIGQLQGTTYRVLKGMHTITPEWIRELANQFILFFEPHKRKILHLYHDRSTNAYRKSKRDFASQLKHDLEYNAQGTRTGWIVNLMSVGQGNITHSDEFNLMNILMGEKDKRLPKLQIDMFECKYLKSQLEMTPVAKGTKGEIIKVKKGDKLPPARLPMESTNYTDALKYLICRSKYLSIARQRRSVTFGPVGVL